MCGCTHIQVLYMQTRIGLSKQHGNIIKIKEEKKKKEKWWKNSETDLLTLYIFGKELENATFFFFFFFSFRPRFKYCTCSILWPILISLKQTCCGNGSPRRRRKRSILLWFFFLWHTFATLNPRMTGIFYLFCLGGGGGGVGGNYKTLLIWRSVL